MFEHTEGDMDKLAHDGADDAHLGSPAVRSREAKWRRGALYLMATSAGM